MPFTLPYPVKSFGHIVFILCLTALTFGLYTQQLHYSATFLIFCIITLFAELYFFQKKHYETINRLVIAMLHDDFSLKINTTQKHATLRSLQLLYRKLQQEQQRTEAKELVYLNIFNNIETGVVILEKTDEQWEVFFINDYFTKYFDIPPIKSWYNFQRLLPGFGHHLEHTIAFGESKGTLDIAVNYKEKQTFLLQTSVTKSDGQEFYILLLDSIQRVLEKKEKETWQNLMKVISHEIMNSLTPIRSLADNAHTILQDAELSEEDLSDLKISMETMINRTNHLQHFINNYRKLTMIPSPIKQHTPILDVIKNSLRTLQPLFDVQKIAYSISCSTPISLPWDCQQMKQVFINLMTNAIHALKEEPDKQLQISIYDKDNRVFIEIIDNGKGIPSEIKDKIFIPFYTTREGGGGIGLPLSKNIVEMHNGYLNFERKDQRTYFVMNFPLV